MSEQATETTTETTESAPAAENPFIAALKGEEGAPAPEQTDAPEPDEQEPEPEPEKKEPKLGSRFAALTKKERALQLKEQEVKREAEEYAALKALKENGVQNPLTALEALGISAEDVVKAVLNQDETPDEPDELSELRKQVEGILEQEKERQRLADEMAVKEQQEALNTALDAYRNELSGFANEHAEQYEFVRALGGINMAMDVMQAFFDEHNEIPDPEKVLDYCEEYLTEVAKGVAGLNKFSQLQQAVRESRDKQTDVQDPKEPSPTLTKRHVAAAPVKDDSRPLTDEERIARAAALLNFK